MKASTISSHPFLQKTLCLVLLACLIAGCVAIGGGNQTAFAETAELSPADLYEQNVNSTVGITISGETSSRYGYGYTYQASGSGFIITTSAVPRPSRSRPMITTPTMQRSSVMMQATTSPSSRLTLRI